MSKRAILLSESGFFDWVRFSPDRLRNPAVIAGVVLMIVGLIVALAGKSIADIVVKDAKDDTRAAADERERKVANLRVWLSALGAVVAVGGALLAVLI